MKITDKAYQLYEKFFCINPEDLTNDECVKFAKQCALIAVEEIISNLKHLDEKWHDVEDCVLTSIFSYQIEYFEDVKTEIENL